MAGIPPRLQAEKLQLRQLEAMAAAQEEAAVRQMETAKAMMRQRESGGATWGQDFSEAEDYAQVVRRKTHTSSLDADTHL